MSAPNPDGWSTTIGSVPGPANNSDQHNQAQQRGFGSYGPGIAHPHGPTALSSGQVLPPPPAPPPASSHFGSAPQAGPGRHSIISSITGLSQPASQSSQSHLSGAPPPPPAAPPQAPGYPLPALGQAVQQPQTRSVMDRDRDLRQMELREREARERHRLHDDRDRDREPAERESRDRPLREPHPHQNHAGSIPIHQPVASKVSTAIHGPGGLLSGIGAGANPPVGLGPSNGPGNLFGGPLPANEGQVRQLQPFTAPPGQHQGLSFTNSHSVHPLSSGVAGLPQGQQPILNDALSYLDQVKVQFVDQPDVYNRFLDIMKDFKSQAIDTPGVIERVSTLFAGHPNLIQGFNTFLPPGYRIECGTGDDPNAIRVTTPMGTTVSSTTAGFRPPSTPSNSAVALGGVAHPLRQGPYYDQRVARDPGSGAWQQQPPINPNVGDMMFSPNGRTSNVPAFGSHPLTNQGQPHTSHPDIHSRDQSSNAAPGGQAQPDIRGLSHMSNAGNAATGTPQATPAISQGSPNVRSAGMTAQPPVTLNGSSSAGLPAMQAGVEKRGPVEFNHAISYVNKIKNRFATQPDIYKQFLEILQTYQRESKPIQDVYAQVTHLFNSAPDLLEDFKQFLPESAAQAKANATMRQATDDVGGARGEPAQLLGGLPASGNHIPGTHRADIKMPPVGNFAPPPSASKPRPNRRNPPVIPVVGTTTTNMQSPDANIATSGMRSTLPSGVPSGSSSNKRAKPTTMKPSQPEAPTISPTLTPGVPEPLPPTHATGAATAEEIAFFDRVKKYIANRQAMNEFLKFCNLFAQDLIDQEILLSRVSPYIGDNPELMSWFKRFIKCDQSDDIPTNNPKPPSYKVNLSNCRGYGPSYRLLPRRERFKTCSGRDELCWSVLNDEWASHPTWASEDSGFVAHRKTAFEESLHRIEEERHDYDFNTEANVRVIHLLEPIAQKIASMTDEERANFTLRPDIAGQSSAIYQRVIKKLYGRERGKSIIDNLYTHPCAVVPVLLNRLKLKTEEWKAIQREWEKIWREQAAKNYWKSLDIMGANVKSADKKHLTAKSLISEIAVKRESQRREQGKQGVIRPHHQLEYIFLDVGVVLDACRLLICFIGNNSNYNTTDRQKLEAFIREFVTTFFGISNTRFDGAVRPTVVPSQVDEEMPDAGASPGDSAHNKIRGAAGGGRKTDLLRGVLNRGRNGKAVQNEGENTAQPGSKETTPDTSPTVDDDADGGLGSKGDSEDSSNAAEFNWVQRPDAGAARKTAPPRPDFAGSEPYRRETYSLYCGTTIYCFFRIFQILCERLLSVKRHERAAAADVRRAKATKPAHQLQMITKRPEDFFEDTSPEAYYYNQVLNMVQDVIEGRMDMAHFEDGMRQYYLQVGWQLYTFDRLFSFLARFASTVVSNDAKDKSYDLMQLFYKNREHEETSHDSEITYRKQAEKLIKEGEVYRVEYTESTRKVTVQLLDKQDPTFDDETMGADARWSYYVASFVKIDPTEGVPLDSRFQMPFFKRNLPDDHDEADAFKQLPHCYEANLQLRICVNSYKMLWQPGTSDWFLHSERHRASGGDAERARQYRNTLFRSHVVGRSNALADMDEAERARAEATYRAWIDGGPGPQQAPA